MLDHVAWTTLVRCWFEMRKRIANGEAVSVEERMLLVITPHPHLYRGTFGFACCGLNQPFHFPCRLIVGGAGVDMTKLSQLTAFEKNRFGGPFGILLW